MVAGKVIVVTGASPNIGGGIAEVFAAAGARLAVVDIDSDNARSCAAAIREKGQAAIGLSCDITDEQQVADAFIQVVDKWGRVDVLVNNAAAFGRTGLLDTSLYDWRRQLNVMMDGTFLCSQIAARRMIAQGSGGSIINIISTAGHQGEPGNIAYGTAKSGLLNFTRSAAIELARHRIRVNSLTPTATDPREGWERARRWGREVVQQELPPISRTFQRHIPMQELPTPADYGQAALFLASEGARMITGIDLRVDGGAIAKYWAWEPEHNSMQTSN